MLKMKIYGISVALTTYLYQSFRQKLHGWKVATPEIFFVTFVEISAVTMHKSKKKNMQRPGPEAIF